MIGRSGVREIWAIAGVVGETPLSQYIVPPAGTKYASRVMKQWLNNPIPVHRIGASLLHSTGIRLYDSNVVVRVPCLHNP